MPCVAPQKTDCAVRLQSLIDDAELQIIQSTAAPMKEQVAAGRYKDAYQTVERTMILLNNYTNNVDYYNFLVFREPDHTADKRAVLETGEYSLR